MSTALPARPRTTNANKFHITIVVSTYNEQYTNALLENTLEELEINLPNSLLDTVRVPGAFEIPVVCELLLSGDNPPDAVIALGVIIQGQTKHGVMVAESVTHTLQSMAVRHAKPIIHEVLLVDDEKQAYARCMSSNLNRGREAARSACSMIQTLKVMNQPKIKKHIAFTKKNHGKPQGN